MRRAYVLWFLIAPTLAGFPEPVSNEVNSEGHLADAQSNKNAPSENAEVSDTQERSININENVNQPTVGRLQAFPKASKKFGVLLINTTDPFVFNPASAAFAFNVSKGRESQDEKSKTVGKDGGKRPDLLRVSANALCQAECEAQEKTFIKVDSEGPSCVCGCPVPERECECPNHSQGPKVGEGDLRNSRGLPVPSDDCCTNNNCNDVCQSARYDGGECDNDGTCQCYCPICENTDDHCIPPENTTLPPLLRRPSSPKRPSKN